MTGHTPNTQQPIGRRGLLAAVGAMGLSASAPPALAASRKLPLTAQTTEGPYYLDVAQMRSDITEGLDGVPLEVCFTVCNAAGKPLRNLRVDLWHCDAQGRYSGFGGQGDDRSLSFEGQTFLRGSQRTDRDGAVSFLTLYPGWYAGRTTHIHFKVLSGTRAVLTSQFFLPDALSEFLYTQVSGYKRARLRDTLNSADGIALRAGDTVLGAVREGHRRYVATLAVVVDPAADPVADRPSPPGAMPPSGGLGLFRGSRLERPQALNGSARTKALVPPRTEG
ncbi:intradiol ring-cleavage dioxygenase [Variovorax sp. ZS18.2.2]|uniref:intradiol ring-cleavage dioxygenase n=1 Tax=Variovorax sp. ZS18.2.2 TaxID=2971255 RepID=UPI002151DABD|nr:intradiol ring-cleavage dioxygenase [Variovorax sp. ZS18.2.2]MCR6477763.1 intradiol ring-cleavage dioxygenase [Variovorax sp. ZS18.2.2]